MNPPVLYLTRNTPSFSHVNPFVCFRCARYFSGTTSYQSGHSRWSTIKHDKARQDASRNKQRITFGKAIRDASKRGGSDAAFNPRLADAIAAAKRAGLPKANIETAIASGQGLSNTGIALEHVLIEALVPPVALIVDCQTDSKARTLQELRALLKERGGTATPTSYMFEKRGRLIFHSKEGVGLDAALEAALNVGAMDISMDDEGRVVVDTEPARLKEAEVKISEDMGLEVASSESIWHPNPETVVEEDAMEQGILQQIGQLQEDLQKIPEVQAVYMNLNLDAAITKANRES